MLRRAPSRRCRQKACKYFFEHQFYPDEQLSKFTEADVGSSSVTTPDNSDLGNDTEHFFFVVPQPTTPDQDFTYIDLWMVDENDNPRRIFHQDANHFGEHMALDIHLLSDVETRDSVYTDKKTGQRITRHLRKGVPVVAMEMQLYNGTVHGIVSTLLPPSSSNARQEKRHCLKISSPWVCCPRSPIC